MDFLDPDKKRSHMIRLFIGYFLVGIAILLGTIILVYQANGYTFDRKTKSIIQKGLVFIDAQPEQASIYLNDELQRSKTDARLELEAGEYRLRLTREGYRQWDRTFTIDGGTVKYFVYPKLFPITINTAQIGVYGDAPPLVTQSDDRRWLMLQTPGSWTDFEVRDLSRPDAPAAPLQIPPSLYALPTNGILQAVEWSDDNQHVLLEHTIGTQTEFLIVHRSNPAAAVNVNRLMAINPTKVALRNKRPDQAYIYEANGGLVRIADLQARTLSAPVLSNVLSFKSHGEDVLVYITGENAPPGKALARIRNDNQTITLRELPAAADGAGYHTNVARFDNHWFYVVASNAEDKVIVFRDPVVVESLPENPYVSPHTILRISKPEAVTFSHNARFLSAQSGQDFVVYDAETVQTFRYKVSDTLGPRREAKWMDGHRLVLTNADNRVVVFDYDGLNRQELVTAAPALPVFFDRDYERMFTYVPAHIAPRFVLERSDLKLNP